MLLLLFDSFIGVFLVVVFGFIFCFLYYIDVLNFGILMVFMKGLLERLVRIYVFDLI